MGGHAVQDAEKFQEYMRRVVAPRLTGDDSKLATMLRGLASTEMATDAIGQLLDSTPPPKGWEVGETLAECVLRDGVGWQVHWPWRTSRDLWSPNAGLQGADLVGFVQRDGKTFLLFGEVKTSGEARTPPTVMTGPGGLPSQLERISLRPDVQHALLSWLRVRCRSQFQRDLFEKATGRYLNSSLEARASCWPESCCGTPPRTNATFATPPKPSPAGWPRLRAPSILSHGTCRSRSTVGPH